MNIDFKTLLLIALLGVVGVLCVTRPTESKQLIQSRVEVERVVEVIYDTVVYHAIEPIVVRPLDTSEVKGDSLYVYRDSTEGRWSAEISGSNVELRSLEIFDQQRVEYVTTCRLPEWEVAVKASVDPYTQWVGVGVKRSFGRVTLALDGGYDLYKKRPYIGVEAAFVLWRE